VDRLPVVLADPADPVDLVDLADREVLAVSAADPEAWAV